MRMELLFTGRFEEYLDEAAMRGHPCIFVHVPKTAGTSLRNELAQLLRPELNIRVDYKDTTRSFHEKMDLAVAAFLDQHAADPLRFASGHVLGRHVEQIRAALPDARLITFLRDPVARLVSDYRYQRSPKHPVHAEFAASNPDLATYVEVATERNKMAQHLVPAELLASGDARRCVDYMLSAYAFIGTVEMYALSFRVLTTLLGYPSWPKLRDNIGPGEEDTTEVPPALAARIRADNAIDCALYDAVHPRWLAVRDALAARFA